jgi:hypothetical protein
MEPISQQHYVPIVKSQDVKSNLVISSSHGHTVQFPESQIPPGPTGLQLPPPKLKKPARDPGAPKRNLSAYLLYQNSMREQFKAQNPGMSFGQLSKYTSAMYAQLSPEEKAVWQSRADADKARYELELASYCPPPGYDQRGEQIIIVPKHKNGKVNRDANAPKRNVSAYLMYQNAMRDTFKAENPGISFGELSRHTSQMYKNLTPEEKMQWEQAARQDKERFLAEISSYHPPPGHDARGMMIENDALSGRKRKRPKDPNAPKRNKGSFVLFAEEERPRIKQEFPDIKFTDMGVILGERWRALDKDQKDRYEAMANQEKARFADEMENYNRQHGLLAEQHSNYSNLAEGSMQVPSSMIDLQMNPSMGMYPTSVNL